MAVPSRIARRLRRSRRAAALYARAQRRSEKVWTWALDFQDWLQTQLFHSGMRHAAGFSRLCFEQLEPRALLTVNWTGLGGNLDWSTAANWDTNVVPTTGDTVMIGSGFAGGTVDDISGLSIQSLSSGSALSITGSLAVTSTVEVDNTFTLNGGTLSDADVLAGSGGQGLTIAGGTLEGVTLDANASLSGATANVQNGLTINGTLNLDAAGNSELDFLGSQTLGGTGAVLFTGSLDGAFSDKLEVEDNGSPATLTIGSGVEIHGGGLGGALVQPSASGGIGAAIINKGQIIADASDQTLSVDLGTDGSSSGTLEATGVGTLAVTGGDWVDSGTNESDSGSTLEFNGVVSNSGNTLNLTGNGRFTSAAEINAGTLSVAAGASLDFLTGGVLNALTLDGNAALSGTTVNVQNGLTLNGILNLNAAGESVLDFIDSQTLDGTGAVLFTGSINPYSDKLEIEDNGSPATLTIGSGIEIHGGSIGGAFVAPSASGGGGIGAAIINNGQIIADAPGRTLSVDLGTDGSSSGTLEATGGGTLSVTGGNWVDSGTNESDSGSTLAFDGVLSNSGNTLNLTGNGQFTSAAEINAGTLSVAAGASLDFLNGGVLNDLTLDGNAALSGATVNVQNGLTLNGILNLDADGDSDLVFIDSQSLGGTGTVLFTGAVNGAFSDNLEIEDNGSPATLTIGSGIEIHGGSVGGASVESDNGDASIINQGQIIADASGRTLTVELGASGSNSGTLGAISGGTLDVSNLSSNSGTISAGVGSTVAITGPMVEMPSGTLSVDIGGPAPGQFGQITATGAAKLDGTLDLNQANGYVPGSGDSIQILTFVGHTGNFATVNSTQIAGQPLFQATTNPNDVTVTAAAAPAPELSVAIADSAGGSSITAAQGNVVPGQTLTYTVTVSNAGPGEADEISVSDLLPDLFLGGIYTAVLNGDASDSSPSGSGDIDDTVDLPAGSSIVYTVTGTVSPAASGTLVNVATVAPGDPVGSSAARPAAVMPLTATDVDNVAVPPVANPDTATTSEDTPVTVNVLANDADPDSTLVPSSVTITSAPLNGLAVVNSDGTITYTPNAGFTGMDQLTYTVQDERGLTSNPATLDLRVDPPATQTGVSVTGNGQSIDNGSTIPSIANGTDFGGISLGDSSLSETYTIHNTGATPLNLGTLSIGGADASDFEILDPPDSTLSAGSSTTFSVRFEPAAIGNRTATVLFTPEDSTPPFTFAIQGTATVAGTPAKLAAQISDDVGGSSVAATDGHVMAGQTLEYFITFINPGPNNVTSATVSDLFPAGLSNIHWTASATPGVSGFSTSGSGNIGDTAVNMPAFTSLTYVVTATVGPNFSGQLTNTATIDGDGTSASATDVDNGSSVSSALPTISIDSITVVKPINGPSVALFTVTLSSPSNVPVSVHFATQDGTAIAGIDYTATSGILTFPKGITSETFSVPILDTLSKPATLTFDVVLSNPVGATTPIATGVGTIFAFAQFIPTSPVVSPETPIIPTGTGAIVSLPSQGSTDVAAARLAANNLLFAYYGSDGSLLLKDNQPWLNHDLAPDLSALGDGPSMPEEPGQEIVLALALTTVPEAEGAALSDERPDPQKLPHLAALDLALPMPTAPIEQAVAAAPRSWWLVGTSAAVLAVSSAVLLAPRWRGKKRRVAGKVAPTAPEATDDIGGR